MFVLESTAWNLFQVVVVGVFYPSRILSKSFAKIPCNRFCHRYWRQPKKIVIENIVKTHKMLRKKIVKKKKKLIVKSPRPSFPQLRRQWIFRQSASYNVWIHSYLYTHLHYDQKLWKNIKWEYLKHSWKFNFSVENSCYYTKHYPNKIFFSIQ